MTTRASIGAIAVGMVLAVLAAPAAQAGPGEMSPEAYQALQRRSLALNAIHGLGKPAGVTHAQYRASQVRSAALNERYGLPVALTSGEIARLYGTGRTGSPELAPAPALSVPRGDAFDWRDAAIGAAFAAALALIGIAGLAVGRRALVPHLRH